MRLISYLNCLLPVCEVLERVLMQEHAKMHLAQERWIQMQNIWSHFLLQLLLRLDTDKVHLAKNYLLPEYG